MSGQPIQTLGLKNRLNANITYGLHFEGYEACIAAGLDLYRWEYGGLDQNVRPYENHFKETVIAWHRLHNAIGNQISDAQVEHIKREQAKAQKEANRKRSRRR